MRCLTDTLAKRLLLLIWAALVLSHLAAFCAVQLLHPPPPRQDLTPGRLPTFPSLPPTPGLPDSLGAHPGPEHGDDAHGMPTSALLLDYGVRLAVIALAAWWGARWVSAPMLRLSAAARQLQLGGHPDEAPLDEHQGSIEVRETTRAFNAMSQQLREQFQSRNLMLAAISHDLRTPLTRLRMRLESMQAEPLQTERSVADIAEMNELLDKTLGLFRDEGAAQQEAFAITDVCALVQAVVDDLAEQGMPLSFSGMPALARVQPQALRRVLDNLVGNALRYGERAALSLSRQGAVIRICVDDEGPGIAEAELSRVFQPFYRVESSRNRSTGGTGLGLYIARDLAQRQGGELRLSKRQPRGLRAELRLPGLGSP